jgi:MarR family transcriptional regulator, transcriptional regulator for hemolysin
MRSPSRSAREAAIGRPAVDYETAAGPRGKLREQPAAAAFGSGMQMKRNERRVDPGADVLPLLYDVARHMRTCADQMAREHGTTRAQWLILLRLEQQPDLSQNELACIAEVAPITVARLVDRLEAAGLVKRCIDPEDRRIWRLRLTPAAAPILGGIKRCRAKLHETMTKDIEPATLQAMFAGLHKMKSNLSVERQSRDEDTISRTRTAAAAAPPRASGRPNRR